MHCSLPSPVRFTDARDVYTFPLLIFCYLCDLATFVKVGTFQLPTFRVRLGRISGLVSPGAPGSVLLDLAPVCHCIPLTSHGHSDSLIQLILSASSFCNNCFFFFCGRGLSALSPIPNLDQGITLCLVPTLCLFWHGWPYQEYMTPANIAAGVIGTRKPPHLAATRCSSQAR